MPANEFEKQVQQRMEDLKLTPSDEVWEEVEHRIRKEKKKRRIFFWLPLLLLILGGGLSTAILLTTNKNNHITHSEELINNLQPNSSSTQKQPVDEASVSKNNSQQIIIEKNKSTEFKVKEYSDNHMNKPFNSKKRFFQKNNEEVKKERKELIQPEAKEVDNNIAATDKSNKQKDEFVIKDNIKSDELISQSKDTLASKEIVAEKKSIEQEIQQADHSIKDSIVSTTTEQKQPIRLKKKAERWQWGIVLQKGESYTGKGIKFIGSNMAADNLYANPNSGVGANPNQASPVYGPSPIRQSGSFAIGVFTKKPVSSKLDVNLSLSYRYLSTKMNVGKKVDSSVVINNPFSSRLDVSNFYRASNSSTSYTNRYHFLSVSAELSWKIINAKKLNIYWNNGVSYDRLLSSNALNYDLSLQGYYKDFSLLTHNHFLLATGFSFPVFKRFDLNPFAEYSLTPLLRHSNSSRTHFSNYGIRVHFLLKK